MAAKRAKKKKVPDVIVIKQEHIFLNVKTTEGSRCINTGVFDLDNREFIDDVVKIEAPCGQEIDIGRNDLKRLAKAILDNI